MTKRGARSNLPASLRGRTHSQTEKVCNINSLNQSRAQYRIAIVILNWNRAHDTLECLESVYKIDYPNFEILLVDNGSTDQSIVQIKTAFPDLFILQNHKNLGYAEGNNRGIAEALQRGAGAILLLNNDTVVDPQILKAFTQAGRHYSQAGVFGAKIYYYEDPTVIWYAGGEVDLKNLHCSHIGRGKSDLEKKHQSIEQTRYACGCALFVKAEVIQKVGLLFPAFFLLWEEVDFCFRARKAGYDCLFVPQARVWHKISRSFEGGHQGAVWQYYYSRNRLLFLRLHCSIKERARFYIKIFPRDCIHLLKILYFSKTLPAIRQQYQAALRGTRDYFFTRF